MSNWEATPKRQLARFTAGSYLHGTQTPESDKDIRNLYAFHPHVFQTISAHKLVTTNTTHWPKMGRDNDRQHEYDVEITEQEIGHFISECYKGSINAVELLWCDDSELGTSWNIYMPIFNMLIDNRDIFLTRDLVDMCLRYAKSQIAEYEKTGEIKPLIHAMRVAGHAGIIMEERRITPRMSHAEVEELKAEVADGVPVAETLAGRYYEGERWIRHHQDKRYTSLPQRPDEKLVNFLLRSIRDQAWGADYA